MLHWLPNHEIDVNLHLIFGGIHGAGFFYLGAAKDIKLSTKLVFIPTKISEETKTNFTVHIVLPYMCVVEKHHKDRGLEEEKFENTEFFFLAIYCC